MKTPFKTTLFALALAGSVAALATGCAGTATSASTGEYIDDATVSTKVKTALIRDEFVKARDVNVETFKGTVQLSGFVDTAAQKERAEVLAKAVQGVQSVKNNIVVKAQ